MLRTIKNPMREKVVDITVTDTRPIVESDMPKEIMDMVAEMRVAAEWLEFEKLEKCPRLGKRCRGGRRR